MELTRNRLSLYQRRENEERDSEKLRGHIDQRQENESERLKCRTKGREGELASFKPLMDVENEAAISRAVLKAACCI